MNKNSSIAIVAGVAIAIAVIASVLAFSGISNDSAPMDVPEQANLVPQEEKLTILTSFYPYHEFTKNVAGDFAEVKQFMPSGVEAHDWEPRAQEIQSLKDADVFVYNGLGMEPYVDQIIDSGEFDNVLFVKASEGVELLNFENVHDEHAKEDDHDDHDEHAKEDDHDESHAEEFHEEIALVIEEFEEGHMTESQSIEAIEEILHEHEGDGHEHGTGMIEEIEHVLHEIEDGHIEGSEGLEEIHHLVSGEDVHDEHAKEDDHDDHDEHEEGGHDGHDHDYEFDPHIWLDPILVKQQVNVIRDGLIQADPQNKEHYEENARIYNNKMDALDMKIGSALSSCQKDTIVPFHNAFIYLGERYDIHIMALSGMTPDSEASAAEIAEFVDFVKDNDIKVIFSEELVDPRLAEVIADEAGAEVILFSPLEALAPDEIGKNVSYIDKMEDNLDSLKVALECQ
ncbi:MAG: zinc ABC transporter substrate-binding protein [Candidatus Nitrosopelagicus sp.]|nr:zinc ABC transporter substrate-binding protein [Candidatus Nitrosopelagicus sp.]